jgi:farnesyl diphosphate synthase
LAFQVISENRLAGNPSLQLEMVRTLAAATGSRGMAGGQQIDLESTGKTLTLPELELKHIHKTGALIRAAVSLGFLSGEKINQEEREKLDRYAKAVGLAFQVVDDVLDSESSTATLGKTAGKDSKQGKSTYGSLVGAKAAREMADSLRADAHGALEGLGPRAKRLGELAEYIVLRKF